jgi:hypothetical protein
MKDISVTIDCYQMIGAKKQTVFSSYDVVPVSNEAAEHIRLSLSSTINQIQNVLSNYDNNLNSIKNIGLSDSTKVKQEEKKSWLDNLFDAIEKDISDKVIATGLIKKALNLLSEQEQSELLRIKPAIKIDVSTHVDDFNKKPM